MPEDPGSDARSPARRRALSIAWALSPTPVVVVAVMIWGPGSKVVPWVAFIAGIANMYAWSAAKLHARRVNDWEMKAVPLTALMCAINIVLVALIVGALALVGVRPP